MRNRSKRNTHRKKDRFIFTNDPNLTKPYADYDFCIKNFISSFEPNNVLFCNKKFGFAPLQYNDFCPIFTLDDLYCLDFIYFDENQGGEGHGRRLMRFILKQFQILIHILDTSLGFFEHKNKDLALEKINNGLGFGDSFVSSNLNINRQPKNSSGLGGCRQKFSGYKRYACPKCSMRFVIENTDKELVRINDSLRSKIKTE